MKSFKRRNIHFVIGAGASFLLIIFSLRQHFSRRIIGDFSIKSYMKQDTVELVKQQENGVTQQQQQKTDEANIQSEHMEWSNQPEDSDTWTPLKLKIIKKQFGQKKENENVENSGTKVNHELRKYKSGEQACRLPNLDIDDPTIKHFFKDPDPLECGKVEKNWVYVKKGKFYIDENAVRVHGGEVSCNYTNFWRIDDNNVRMETEIDFKSGSNLKGDFFTVNCGSKGDGAAYNNVHAGIVPTEDALKRAKETKLPEDALGLNVYMFGFDSLSRLTFMRKLPKFYKYLTEQMDGIVLEGYNIVGDGTPQALIPILTGKTEEELPLTRKRYKEANYVNVYPFVWNEYRGAGYVTVYGEDAASIGTFTYRLKGFDEQPTDHYMRTFYVIGEKEAGKHKSGCWGSEEHHKTHFDYIQHLWETYPRETRKFAFQFHSVFSHDSVNRVQVADDYMLQHMKFFVENGYANDTIFIVMADHGHRFADLRETQQGKLEERLPFFSFVFPPWFKEKYPHHYRTFRTNARRLTTPFDIHPTLREILKFEPRSKMGNIKNRGLSLFHEIPMERTCADAGIEPHWCTCLDWRELEVTDRMAEYIARSLVTAINRETERERKLCSKIKLEKIQRAAKYTPVTAVLSYKNAADPDGFVPNLSADGTVQMEYYQVDIWTSPGNAHYEAQITLNTKNNELIVDLDVVSHVNKYGDLPHCIIDKDYFLAKWCVCYDKINSNN